MNLTKNIRYTITLTVLLVIISSGNNTALASEQQKADKIDIEATYSSDFVVLAWNEEKAFDFEISTPNTEFTFKITDLNASLFHYVIEPVTMNTTLTLNDGAANDDTSKTLTDENLPIGYHIELEVVRRVSFTKAGNYTLEFVNTHEHPADAVKFKFEFISGFTGEESFGTTTENSVESETPGFALGMSLLVILGIVISKKRLFPKVR